MGLDQDIESLIRVKLFEGFPTEQLRLLAFGAKHQFKRSDETIFVQNEISKGGYIILNGQIDLFVHKGEREIPISSFVESGIIGEMALISANRCVATAISRTDSELLFISRDLFQRMLEEYPELAIMLHERIGNSVKALILEMETVQRKMLNIGKLS